MTVISEGPLCLKIHLNKYELKKYFNSYNEISIENPNAKRTIGILFNIAINMSAFETKGKRLIEVFPTASGGCILKFTSNPLPFETTKNKNQNLRFKNQKSKNNPYIFCFKDFENLLLVIEKLYKNNVTKLYTASVYRLNKKYFLKIHIPVYDLKTGLLTNEFAEYSTKGKMAECLINEYAKPIVTNNAIKEIGKYFYKKSKTTDF
ncbi:MAG: hypothetical protein E7551_02885 [Ruminococcaceae bacterium]|nr:hypothetical protein [Oscillospiraceae bacterium]